MKTALIISLVAAASVIAWQEWKAWNTKQPITPSNGKMGTPA